MKKIGLMLIVCIILSSVLFAETKKTVAVLEFEGGTGQDGITLADLFASELANKNIFIILTRTSVDAIMKEHNFQRSLVTDTESIKAIGELVNADYIVAGKIATLGDSELLTVQMINVVTGQVEAGEYVPFEKIIETLPYIETMVAEIAGEETVAKPVPKVVAEPSVNISSASIVKDPVENSDSVLQVEENQIILERVAVLPFTGGEGNEGVIIAQMLGAELSKLGYFKIAPRTAAINKVMEEHNFQRGGLTDGDTIAKLGRGENAKYVVSGHIQSFGDRKMISASIVDVETFQQVAGGYYEYDDLSEVSEYLPALAEKFESNRKNDYSGVPTLAILPFDGVNESNADVLAQLLAIELSNTGKYVVVSRTTTIENVMKEQNIQISGLTDNDTISQLGVAMNADYILYGSAYSLGSTGIMNATIIDVSSLIQEQGAYVEYETIEDGVRLIPVLSYDLTGVKKEYRIGEIGPGGGLVFHIEGNKYFECSEVLGEEEWANAMALPKYYRGGGYSDWYLPSKEELNYIYENLRVKGFISDDDTFWSSSEYDTDTYAWYQGFTSGTQKTLHKTLYNSSVFAVRAF